MLNKVRLAFPNAASSWSGAAFESRVWFCFRRPWLDHTCSPWHLVKNFAMINSVPLLLATRPSSLPKQGHFGYRGGADLRMALICPYLYILTSVANPSRTAKITIESASTIRKIMTDAEFKLTRSRPGRKSDRSLYISMKIPIRKMMHSWMKEPTGN